MTHTFGLSLIFGGMMVIGAPFVVLTVVPVLGTLFSLALAIVMIWGFYSQYRLIKEVHGLSTARGGDHHNPDPDIAGADRGHIRSDRPCAMIIGCFPWKKSH